MIAAAADRDGTVEAAPRPAIEIVLFNVRSITFGVVLDQVEEIAEVDEFVRVTSEDPDLAALRGALLCRDRPLPMVDVGRRIGLAAGSRYLAPVLLVADVSGHDVGFLVDDPEDVVAVAVDRFRPLPPIIERAKSLAALYALALHGARLVQLLDLELLLSEGQAAAVCQLARQAFATET